MVVPHKRTRSDVLLTRSPLAIREQALYAAVRLACVKHAASVQSEPGSNSSVQSLFATRKWQVVLNYSPEIEKVFMPFLHSLIVWALRDIFWVFRLDDLRRPHLSVRYLVFKERVAQSDKDRNHTWLKSVLQVVFEKFLNLFFELFNTPSAGH